MHSKLFCAAGALAVSAVFAVTAPASAKGVMLLNRIGPSKMALYMANADGSGERRLLPSSAALDYDASFSADGKWIVFTSERDAAGDGQADIYRVHPDGSGLERLTRDPALEDAGVLSPDGKTLAFVSTKGGRRTPNIWVMDLKSKKARRITGSSDPKPPETMAGHFRPSWSPDGRWIAFSSDDGEHWAGAESGAGVGHSQPLSIYIVHPDGTGLRRLSTLTPKVSAGSPRWSADGKSLLVYEAETKDSFAGRMGGFTGQAVNTSGQIYEIDVATGAQKAVTSGPGLKTSPQYLPGGRFGYIIKGSPKDGPALGIAYSDGGRGPAGAVRSPSWSPDGKTVTYYRFDTTNRLQYTRLYSWDSKWDYRYTDVFPTLCPKTGKLAITDLNFPFGNPDASVTVMNPDGTERRRIFHRTDGQALMPTWSPDCQWIAVGFGTFFGGRDFRPGNIMLIKADGSEVKPLTQGDLNIGFPAWSADGKTLVYRVWGKERGLRAMNLEDHTVKTLTTEWDNFPFFSPSGDRILFTRQMPDKDFEVFTMKPDGSDQKRLTYTPGADAHATWSADGKEIWFESSRTGFKDEAVLYDTSPQPYAQIFLMNRDGSNVRQFTDSKWEDSMGTFLPQ
jgi:Tol biopolymer transport system component